LAGHVCIQVVGDSSEDGRSPFSLLQSPISNRVSSTDERTLADLTIRIDRTLCVGFGDCVEAAPEAFGMDGEDVVMFLRPEETERERLLVACRACPVDALVVLDARGEQIVP